jgi:GNAT superfamily N-acetyltransferase
MVEPEAQAQTNRAVSALSFVNAKASDFETLLALRIEVMRESLERIGRFDPERARARFQHSFSPDFTRWICIAEARVGFVAVKPEGGSLLLDHLYVHRAQQGRGIGSAVLAFLFAEADSARLALRVGALRGSDSNRFYTRHGFVQVEAAEFDNYYVRAPAALSGVKAI